MAHYDMRFVKPIDELLLHEVFGKFKHVITHRGPSRAAWAVRCWSSWAITGYAANIKRLGMPTAGSSTVPSPDYAECGIDDKAFRSSGEGDVGEQEGEGCG